MLSNGLKIRGRNPVPVRVRPPAPRLKYGERPMMPGAGDPLKPSGRSVDAPDFVDTIGFEYGSTSILLDQLAVDRRERCH